MMLTDEELARIPISPRAKSSRPHTKPVRFQVQKDPAVMVVARMVVAGVDKKYNLHPHHDVYVEQYGEERAHELIVSAVSIPGGCDIIQTDMCYGGVGLFGALANNSSRFIFHEWSDGGAGLLSVSMTKQEARDIVAGKKKTIVFKPYRFRVRICIDPFKRRESEDLAEYLQRSRRSIANERIYTRDSGAWALPAEDYEDYEKGMRGGEKRYLEKFRVVIGRKAYYLAVSNVTRPFLPAHDRRVHIFLEVPSDMKDELRKALSSDKRWKLRGRNAL